MINLETLNCWKVGWKSVFFFRDWVGVGSCFNYIYIEPIW